jgi:ATP-dependent Lon protease
MFGDDDDFTDNEALEVEAVPHEEDEANEGINESNLDAAAILGTMQKADDQPLPEVAVALPINQRPIFPLMTLPLVIPVGPLADAVVRAVKEHEGHVAFFMTKHILEDGADYNIDDLHDMGSLARILKHKVHEDGNVQVFVHVLSRFRRLEELSHEDVLLIRGEPIRPQVDRDDPQIRALVMGIVSALKQLIAYNPVFEDEIKVVLANFNNLDGPGRLTDLAASLTTAKREEVQAVLDMVPLVPRMEKVLVLLAKETELAQLKNKIAEQINTQVDDHQRKFFLNEQLKAIKAELGIETDEKSLELGKLQEAFEARRDNMSDEAVEVVEAEMEKLRLIEPGSSEYAVARGRLEWIVDLPWGITSEDNNDLIELRAGLDADHYGLEDIKERIIEFCAVRALKPDKAGGIITLVGPPGTGKTSIGISIAKQLGREFYRFSVGGMRDEAEIKGHRRTYVGALPGKIAQALRRSGSMNPVILLDEIDKLGQSFQGDPASALLEVLDPEQNRDFLDHYLDIRLDLSQVLFVCTANDLSGIPDPLRDRMEIIRLAGYVDDEKIAIASKYIVPKQRKEHGLATRDISINKSAVKSVIRDYAREAGVRQAELLIAKICRKVATEKASNPDEFIKKTIKPDTLATYLGQPYMRDDELLSTATPGVVTGLAWTSMGGATLEIEALAIPQSAGKGGFQLSGQLGDVMKESAGLARSFLRANAARLGISADWFDNTLIHIHVPAGATPKDGPSAGITMATAMLSLALEKPVRRKVGMTGELTLTGRVYPIGGVREKLVAARRNGLKLAVFPEANRRDVAELPDRIKAGIEIAFVSQLDDVLELMGLS